MDRQLSHPRFAPITAPFIAPRRSLEDSKRPSLPAVRV
jgi:hypothetical protein